MDFLRFPFDILCFFAAFVLLSNFCSHDFASAAPIISENQAMIYLNKYGYLDEWNSTSGPLPSEETVSKAIKDFQKFTGLNETGVLDSATLSMMNMPRCNVTDKIGPSGLVHRRKRFAYQGSKWGQSDLTYRISEYPKSRLQNKESVDKEIEKAFKLWSGVTNLNFTKKATGTVDIDLRFENRHHERQFGDEKFDGPGGTLAHAFFPEHGGAVHFDDEEPWSIDQNSGTNLIQVAAHELGHSLGLQHSDVKSSLMYPFYRGYQPNFSLHKDDILGIQGLYGERKKVPPTPKPRPTSGESGPSDLCQDSSIDAVTRTVDGRTYVFKGNYYWEILKTGIADGYPRNISDDWSGLPGNLDAAVTTPKSWNGKTFFFKGKQYWRFLNKKMDSGYPKLISEGFDGIIPDDIDAAFFWSGNNRLYVFKGDNYWRLDNKRELLKGYKYPKPISNWEGLPNNIDAALQWADERTYFFKGSVFYKFNDKTFSVEKDNPTYPRSTSGYWFKCK